MDAIIPHKERTGTFSFQRAAQAVVPADCTILNYLGRDDCEKASVFMDLFIACAGPGISGSLCGRRLDAGMFAQLSGTDSIAFDSALTEILLRFFDDGHSGIVRNSWRSGLPKGAEIVSMRTNLGYSTMTKASVKNRLTSARLAAYPEAGRCGCGNGGEMQHPDRGQDAGCQQFLQSRAGIPL